MFLVIFKTLLVVKYLTIVRIVTTLMYCVFDTPDLKSMGHSGGDGWKTPMNRIVSSPKLL